jgi:hypothetical protein
VSDFLTPEHEAEYRRTLEFDVRRQRRHVPHNHTEKQKIIDQLRISPLEQFFLWLSKTDIYAMALSTYQSRMTLSGLGMMVFFTSTLAFCTATYTIATTMVTTGGGERWVVILFLGALYSFGIMIIDREIVGSQSSGSVWKNLLSGTMRLIFALCISITIAFPVELKLFEGRIAREIQSMETAANAQFQRKIDEIRAPSMSANQSALDSMRASINSYNAEIATLTREIDREANDVECAAQCQSFRRQKEEAQAKLREEQARMATLMNNVALPPVAAAQIKELEQKMKDNVGRRDLMTQWEALERLKANPNSNFALLAAFITFFFLMLELVPLSLKATLGKTEYSYYLEARAALNSQKVIGIANHYLLMMKSRPTKIESVPTEITDIIARHMEDEAMAGPEYDDPNNPDNHPISDLPPTSDGDDPFPSDPPTRDTNDERGGGL